MPLVDVPWPSELEPIELAPLEPEEDIQFAEDLTDAAKKVVAAAA